MNALYYYDPDVAPVLLEIFEELSDKRVNLGKRNAEVRNDRGEIKIVEKLLVVGNCPILARAGEEGYCVPQEEKVVINSQPPKN